jgi:hypothetical protein
MKKVFVFLSAIFCLCTVNKTMAQKFSALNQDGKNIYYNITSSTAPRRVEVASGGNSGSYSGAVVIPSTVTYSGNTYSVTAIGNYAFSGCKRLTTITIPNSVTSIGNWAFSDCSGLTSITIPNLVTSIGDGAFYDCYSLTSVIFNATNCTYMGSDYFNPDAPFAPAFYHCLSLTIGSNVQSIPTDAFSHCNNLTSIFVNVNNKVYCSNNGVLFNKDQTRVICYPADKQGSYTIPKSVTTIGDYAFRYCKGLTSVTIPNSVTSIGNEAFLGCDDLTSVSIPNSVTTIGYQAFQYCENLISVTIPNSVTTIGYQAFSDCDDLISITVDTNNSNYSSVTGVLFSKLQDTLIQYPAGKAGSYTIPNSVTTIGYSAFSGCNGLISLTIPNSVTTIESYAFSNCFELTSITMYDPIPSMTDNIFSNNHDYNYKDFDEHFDLTVTVYDTITPIILKLNAEDYRLLIGFKEQLKNKLIIHRSKKAIDINPDNVEAYIAIGLAYYELRDYPQAIKYYKMAIIIDPNNESAYFEMEKSYECLKNNKYEHQTSNRVNATNLSTSAPKENISTQNVEKSTTLNATRTPTPKPTTPNRVKTENVKVDETPTVNPNVLFRRNATQGSGVSGSRATSGSGTGTGSNYGSGAGNYGGDFFLDGRPVIITAFPKAKNNLEGVVKVDFRADREGNVIYAKAGGRGTTINDSQIWKECENAAMRSKFKAKQDAPIEERGTITYKFVLQ